MNDKMKNTRFPNTGWIDDFAPSMPCTVIWKVLIDFLECESGIIFDIEMFADEYSIIPTMNYSNKLIRKKGMFIYSFWNPNSGERQLEIIHAWDQKSHVTL